jgi:hypothetical protein
MDVQLGRYELTNLADQRPRRGRSRPRIVENSDTYFLLHTVCKKKVESENIKYMFTCMF